MTKTVLILGGSGKIGRHSAAAFRKAGWQVRQFDRVRDDMTRAAMGCDVIVNGLNPPNYHDWAGIIPQICIQLLGTALAWIVCSALPAECLLRPGILKE